MSEPIELPVEHCMKESTLKLLNALTEAISQESNAESALGLVLLLPTQNQVHMIAPVEMEQLRLIGMLSLALEKAKQDYFEAGDENS